MQDSSIREALQEGLHLIYSELFDPDILFYPFLRCIKDIYEETEKFEYETPIVVVGKVVFKLEKGDTPVTVDRNNPIIKVAKKGFPISVIDNEDFLKRSMFKYKGRYFKAFYVEYTNMIQGEPLTYTFQCKEVDYVDNV